jgi:hypothetical protein
VCVSSVVCVCRSERGLDLEATELADDAAVWQLEGAALVCCQSCILQWILRAEYARPRLLPHGSPGHWIQVVILGVCAWWRYGRGRGEGEGKRESYTSRGDAGCRGRVCRG